MTKQFKVGDIVRYIHDDFYHGPIIEIISNDTVMVRWDIDPDDPDEMDITKIELVDIEADKKKVIKAQVLIDQATNQSVRTGWLADVQYWLLKCVSLIRK